MKDSLIEHLSKLEIKAKHLKRCLDITYYNKEQRQHFFEEYKKVKEEIERIKFKIKINKEMKR